MQKLLCMEIENCFGGKGYESKSMWLVSLHLIGLILQFEYNLFVIGHPTNGSLLSAMQHNTESGVSQR